jgi:hypothetical protein
MKFIFLIFIFISFLRAEENVTFLINQKYLCTNLGALIKGKIVPIIAKEDYLKYPIRFYLNDKKILFTDGKSNNKYTYNEKSNLYINENSAIDLIISNGVRYMINMPISGDSKGVPYIYNCVKTERWSLY